MAYKLPTEILLIVFGDYLEINQLMKCRMVCKAWARNAEMAVSGKPIVITNQEMAEGFYEHFVQKSEFGRDIKHMTFACQPYEDFNGDQSPFKKILKSLIYERLEVINGEVSESFGQLLTDIDTEKEGGEVSKLKRLPDPAHSIFVPEASESALNEAALLFTASLERLRLLIHIQPLNTRDGLVMQLGTFERLTSIDLVIYYPNMSAMNDMAENWRHPQELRLSADCIDYWTTEQIQTAFRSHFTQKTSSLKVLKLEDCYAAIPVEFFVMKYASIEFVSINLENYQDYLRKKLQQKLGHLINDNLLLRLAKALNGVQEYEIRFFKNESLFPWSHFQEAAAATGHDFVLEPTDIPDLMILKAKLRQT
ncbi:hypothetical protein [Parasitella parasitica]|uniref:F-box domain-containing protein n=1 Tax=Parasitella parasitica TaxID=35722 RepID=A0A0B7NLP7_9FUNG|nr:hypothetical protein [Parasitella parasitica]